MAQSLPAWPFLLGALVAFGLGVAFFPMGQPVVAIALLVASVGLAYMGVKRGRSIAAGTAGDAAATPTPLEARERTVEDYADAKAVKSKPKAKRLCPECRSPVLENASECPTCSTPLTA